MSAAAMHVKDLTERLGTLRSLGGSLALLRGQLSPSEVEAGIRRKYSEPLEIETACRHTAAGLTAGERALLQRHLGTGARVLDIGCATGRVALALSADGHRVVGVDLNETMIRIAARLATDAGRPVPVAVSDARHLSFRDGVFDAVLMIGSVLGYVRGRAARIGTLAEIRRILRPGGRFLVVTPSRSYTWTFKAWFAAMWLVHRVLRLLGRTADWDLGDRLGPAWSGDTRDLVYWHMYSPRELEADLNAAGLNVIEGDPNAYMMSYVARRPERARPGAG